MKERHLGVVEPAFGCQPDHLRQASVQRGGAPYLGRACVICLCDGLFYQVLFHADAHISKSDFEDVFGFERRRFCEQRQQPLPFVRRLRLRGDRREAGIELSEREPFGCAALVRLAGENVERCVAQVAVPQVGRMQSPLCPLQCVLRASARAAPRPGSIGAHRWRRKVRR